MPQITYNRTELTEARRRLSQAETWYQRMCEKNREAEEKYRDKIGHLEDRVTELQKESN